MSSKLNLLNGLLTAIATLHPEHKVAIGTIIHNEPLIESLAPVVTAGLQEGPGVVAAIHDKAPDLLAAIKSLVAAAPAGGGAAKGPIPAPMQRAQDLHVENVARSLFGLSGMTTEEQTAWMNSKSPISGRSDVGSG